MFTCIMYVLSMEMTPSQVAPVYIVLQSVSFSLLEVAVMPVLAKGGGDCNCFRLKKHKRGLLYLFFVYEFIIQY